MLEFLQGKKTYILAGLGALLVFGKLIGWIDEQTFEALFALLGFGSFATLRSAVK